MIISDLDLEEGASGAVANITCTDHVHPSSHTRSLDNGYHRLRTLKKKKKI